MLEIPEAPSPFRVLFRHFLFRVVDAEIAPPDIDIRKLLGQFSAVLLLVGMMLALSALGLSAVEPSRAEALARAWPLQHALIATTMLVVGIFAVLNWDAVMPDRLDMATLGTLPISARTMLLAKVSATGCGLGIAIVALNLFPALAVTLALAPPSASMLDVLISTWNFRATLGYWFTVTSSGAFVFCCVLALRGVVSLLLPTRLFLRISAWLQIAVFLFLVIGYIVQPALARPSALSDPARQTLLAWLPSYWFLGMLQQLIGEAHAVTDQLAQRAWFGLAAAALTGLTAYGCSYRARIRTITEQPDIANTQLAYRREFRLPEPLTTALLNFSCRTLLRSRQHRAVLSFYVAIGLAAFVGFLRTPRGEHMVRAGETAFIFASLTMMTAFALGVRVAAAIPIHPGAAWQFRVTQIRPGTHYLSATRFTMVAIACGPVWACSTSYMLLAWPVSLAIGHSMSLALWGLAVALFSLRNFRKLPFACSWAPGRSPFHMIFLGVLALIFTLAYAATVERRALDDPQQLALWIAGLSAFVFVARKITTHGETAISFEEQEAPVLNVLGLTERGVFLNDDPLYVTGPGLKNASALPSPQCSAQVFFRPDATSRRN